MDQAISVAVRQPTTFVLETDELLKESRLDYEKTFEGVDDLLRRIKAAIESIEPHEPLPVSRAVPPPLVVAVRLIFIALEDCRRCKETEKGTQDPSAIPRACAAQGFQLQAGLRETRCIQCRGQLRLQNYGQDPG